MTMMHKNRSVDLHQFAMIPSAEIPRSTFRRETNYKTTMDAGKLIPFFVDEVLPGDTHKLSATLFARMTTPLYPIMDNLHIDTQFFFVPNRLVWDNWVKMMGEQKNPGDSISYTVPQCVSPNGGYAVGSLQDYLGLQTVGQIGGGVNISHANLIPRAYNLIYNEWYRDENLQNAAVVDTDDGPDTYTDYVLLNRGKRPDYFTVALPWPQKGGTPVTIPLGTSAPVKGIGISSGQNVTQNATGVREWGGTTRNYAVSTAARNVETWIEMTATGTTSSPMIYADLSAATAATINTLRLAFATQKILERDARGGTRYTEILWSHFKVKSPDARLQRPEYLGGGSTPVNIHPIAQQTQTGLTGGSTPMGTLGAVGTAVAINHGFTQAFTEHGHIIGIASIRADLNYQQGMRRMWDRKTRYDFYLPAFANLGEQGIKNKEIYQVGSATGGITAGDQDEAIFGYQERWGELRYLPTLITGLFKSTAAGTLDGWHLAQKFTSLPTLNDTFIKETPPMARVLAVSAPTSAQFYLDVAINVQSARPLPLYSVPGQIDRF